MPTRREFLGYLASAPLAAAACAAGTGRALPPGARAGAASRRVNDVHSRLNDTWVERVLTPDSTDAVRRAVLDARRAGRPIAIAGGRHAMGGQQFVTGGWLLDMRALARVRGLDRERGLLTAGAGIEWPDVLAHLERTWAPDGGGWGIVQKQTGADRLSLGGALAANVHGRVLTRPPIVSDVERFVLVDARGEAREVSRSENADLFRLAIGGYGLFGVITEVTLRLIPRQKVERTVVEARIEDVAALLDERIEAGHLYGDFQYGIDSASETEFLRRGILSTYRPVPPETPIPADQRRLSEQDWGELLVLAHTAPSKALEAYLAHYLATDGQVYWADTQQLGFYQDDYHVALNAALGRDPLRGYTAATEIITELYVPPERLADFMAAAAGVLRTLGAPVIYGTVRLIEPDTETVLAWARRRYACVVFNLHTEHTSGGLARSAAAFRALIDAALRREGSYYLTYHRFATRPQVEAAYPQFAEFLARKRVHDPEERFQSDWYRHYRKLFDA